MNVSRRRALGVVGVVVLALAAAVLAALAIDVVRVSRTAETADVGFVTRVDTGADWTSDTLLPSSAAVRLLGVRDDLRYRAAVRRFWLSQPRAPLRTFADVTRRAAVDGEIAQLAEQAGQSPGKRSVLATMRGGLLLEEARSTPSQREVFVRRAIEQFQRAVTLDPSNDDAVHDLELALKLLRSTGQGESTDSEGRQPLPSPGAGAATSGSGF